MSEAKIRILDVAEKLFMEKGFELVKLRDIATVLEIKQPSLYYHFPDGKEQIYFEVVSRALDHIQQGLQLVIDDAANDTRSKLMGIGHWAEEYLNMSPTVIFRMDLPLLNEEYQRILANKTYQVLFLPMIKMFQRFIQDGEMRDIDTAVLTGTIVSIMEGINQSGNWQTQSRSEMWEKTIDILLFGIMR